MASRPKSLAPAGLQFLVMRGEGGRLQKRPPKTGRRLSDVVAEFERTPQGAKEMLEGRQWTAEKYYGSEPQSLQALRLKNGLSQGQLASAICTTQARISRIENGLESPGFDIMKRLVAVLAIDMNTLAAAIDHAQTRNAQTHA